MDRRLIASVRSKPGCCSIASRPLDAACCTSLTEALPPNPGCICVSFSSNARVVRWPHGQYLIDEQGRARKAWEIARGKRAWGKRRIWNAHLHRHLETSVLAFPVRHPDFAGPDVPGGFPTGQRTPPLVSGFPPKRSSPSSKPGRSCLPTPADGISRARGALAKASWALSVRGCAMRNAAANC